MPRTVILRHTLPDGSHHFDWMLDRGGAPLGSEDERTLITFRIDRPPTEVSPLDAERLADHRRLYLGYEGPVSGGRGSVRRVISGEASIIVDHEDQFECEVRFDAASGPDHGRSDRWVGHPIAGSLWRLVRHVAARR